MAAYPPPRAPEPDAEMLADMEVIRSAARLDFAQRQAHHGYWVWRGIAVTSGQAPLILRAEWRRANREVVRLGGDSEDEPEFGLLPDES